MCSFVKTDCFYYISDAFVKRANKRFNSTGHDYELTMTANTEIAYCYVQMARPCAKSLSVINVPSHKNENIDVFAVVDHLDSFKKIKQSFAEDTLGQTIYIKGALVKEWNGKLFSLATTSASKIDFNPEIDGVPGLVHWYVNMRAEADVKTVSVAGQRGIHNFSE
ncbi:unnamed protein product [Cylicostephanus goldi]|uniref:Uncharacterized protein n=1 Tax=Cylicostephanus goldi TaxID=71465 RepID=A0A3P7PVE7_CYLGO|nr:unnamed protein product [Cylicostephanus goldi]